MRCSPQRTRVRYMSQLCVLCPRGLRRYWNHCTRSVVLVNDEVYYYRAVYMACPASVYCWDSSAKKRVSADQATRDIATGLGKPRDRPLCFSHDMARVLPACHVDNPQHVIRLAPRLSAGPRLGVCHRECHLLHLRQARLFVALLSSTPVIQMTTGARIFLGEILLVT